MFYFVYCADRPGSAALRDELVEAHWAYMDGFARQLYARGPTLTAGGGTATGSLHVADLPSDDAARAFGEREPNWRAGVYASMALYRFDDLLGRSMWAFPGPGGPRFLVVALGPGDPGALDRARDGLIVLGHLRSTGDGAPAGAAACVQAPDAATAAAALAGFAADELTVRPWRFGGRPAAGD
ncbi:YciI family protein [Dactylosporangium sp. CA-052675]|uniref:YciI family protein n=1 Tax=Dactylosporangium sp. CA-052675 TaxID=3239927 RepID=UPI003D92B91D